jgi:hypothetical protein
VTSELVRYDAMCQAIAAAYQVDEVKGIRDRAVALEHYSRLAHNVEAERQCCEIRLSAERRAGQLLKGRRQPRGNQHGRSSETTLHDLDITKDQSSQWQQLAGISEAKFELALTGPEKPTTNSIINGAKPKEITPVSEQALWVWGRLLEFERRGILDIKPGDVIETMTPEMIGDIPPYAERVARWLVWLGEVTNGA